MRNVLEESRTKKRSVTGEDIKDPGKGKLLYPLSLNAKKRRRNAS